MTERPHVLLSVAASVDGYIDDASDRRLLLSNEADFDRVDETRAACDAIMIGAETIRRDDPRLLVNSPRRREQRVARGLPEYPLKATLTAGGNLNPDARFFTTGGEKVVYCASPAVAVQAARFAEADGVAATAGAAAAGTGQAAVAGTGQTAVAVVDAGDPLSLATVLDDLGARGVRRLMVEGGTSLHTRFLTSGLVDEIHLAIAPFFVGDPNAPRFVGPGTFPQDPSHRMIVAETREIGDIVLIRYLVAPRSHETVSP
jgi:5-amino-6-(5-phosphoribosylamino)uracil reductase